MKRFELLKRIEWVLSNTTAYHEKTHENVPEALVEALESAFGKVFPEDYRKFLVTFGCVEGDIQILGVPKETGVSVLEGTNLKKKQHALDDILVVRQDDYGNFDFIDLARSTKERSVVCSYSAESGTFHTTPYVDFHSYLLYALLVFENSERTAEELVELDNLIDSYIHERQ